MMPVRPRIRILISRAMVSLFIATFAFPIVLYSADSTATGASPDALPLEIVRELQSRGLIGGKLTEDLASGGIPAPPNGVEIDETRAGRIDADPDTDLSDWREPLGRDWLNIRVSKRADGGANVSYWVIPGNSLGCLIYIYKIYSQSGRVLRSEYWTHTNELKTASDKNFPAELYPYGPDGGIPASEIVRSLNIPSAGGSGKLYTQYTPEGYVILDIWVDRAEDITVPAGKFSALHVMMRPNLESFLPDWPSFALKMFEPFLPKESFYFEAQPPYRFLKFEGIPGAAGPKVRSELVRYYTAGKQSPSAVPPTESRVSR